MGMICGRTSARSARTSAITSPPKSDIAFLKKTIHLKTSPGGVKVQQSSNNRKTSVIKTLGAAPEKHSPLFKDLQCEVKQLPFALLPPLDHFQDCDSSAEIPA